MSALSSRATPAGLHTVGRNLAENVSEHVEHVDFFSENTIGACVTCCVALIIWLVFLPVFHLVGVPYMESWESIHPLTLPEYMQRAEETYATPGGAFEVLDSDGDGNSTRQEFEVGSATFKRPPFPYPAAVVPIFEQFDNNKDGKIQDKEFYRFSPSGVPSKWHINMTDLKARAKSGYGFLDSYFTAMDLNSDSKVDEAEFVAKAKELTPPVQASDAKKLFKEADTDGMGFIEPREWVSYTVNHTFSFKAGLDLGVKPTGPKVMMAVTAGLSASLQILPADLLTINSLTDITNSGDSKTSRRLDGAKSDVKLNQVKLSVTFTVLIGTRSRMNLMKSASSKLPDSVYMSYFENTIGGGSTTQGPSVANPTTGPAAKSGPVSDKELEGYMNVPAVIQGRTVLQLSHAAAGVHSVEKQEAAVKPIFKSTMDTFFKCQVSVESVQTEVLQDETGSAPANKSLIISWTTDSKNGGKFESRVKDDGWLLTRNIKQNIVKEKLPVFVGTSIDSWTRFSATYYGSLAEKLSRGPVHEQYSGHFPTPQGIKNYTGSSPFVKAAQVASKSSS